METDDVIPTCFRRHSGGFLAGIQVLIENGPRLTTRRDDECG